MNARRLLTSQTSRHASFVGANREKTLDKSSENYPSSRALSDSTQSASSLDPNSLQAQHLKESFEELASKTDAKFATLIKDAETRFNFFRQEMAMQRSLERQLDDERFRSFSKEIEDIIKVNGERYKTEQAKADERYKAEQAKADERYKAEQAKADERYKATRDEMRTMISGEMDKFFIRLIKTFLGAAFTFGLAAYKKDELIEILTNNSSSDNSQTE